MKAVAGGESQGAPAAVQPPPAAEGQGSNGNGEQPPPAQQQPGSQDGFWGNFPDVPEEMRSQLEPHLKNVQAHVTQLEQRLAPLKNLQPEEIQGLANYAQMFDQNPLETWIATAKNLQQAGVLHQELDLDAVQAAAQGRFDDDEDTTGGGGTPDLAGVDPGIAQYIQRLEGQIQELSSGFQTWQQQDQQRQTQQRQEAENRAFENLKSQVKQELLAAKIPEDLLTDQELTARFIVHRGQKEAVKQSFLQSRDSFLKGLAGGGKQSEQQLQVNGDLPGASKSAPRNSFDKAAQGARAFLERGAERAAQGT